MECVDPGRRVDLDRRSRVVKYDTIGNGARVESNCRTIIRVYRRIGNNVRINLGANSELIIDENVKISSRLVVTIPGRNAAIVCDAQMPADARLEPEPD